MSTPTLPEVSDVGVPGGIQAQLDRISAQLADLVAAQAAERQERERWAELVHELTPVAQAAMALASDELADLTRDVSIDDVTRFARTLVRALPQLEAMLVQLASVGELVHEVTSLTGAGMGALSDVLGEAERRGYFAAARGGGAVLDRMAVVLTADVEPEAPSMLTLLRQLRDPRTRRGLVRALELVRALDPGTPGSPTTPRPPTLSAKD